MVLLTKELRTTLPDLYSQEQNGLEALAVVKFFTPDSSWTWYASEGSLVDENSYYDTDKEKVDFLFFGLVVGHEVELGYFSLAEIENVRGLLGLPVERDLYFEPTPLRELLALAEKAQANGAQMPRSLGLSLRTFLPSTFFCQSRCSRVCQFASQVILSKRVCGYSHLTLSM